MRKSEDFSALSRPPSLVPVVASECICATAVDCTWRLIWCRAPSYARSKRFVGGCPPHGLILDSAKRPNVCSTVDRPWRSGHCERAHFRAPRRSPNVLEVAGGRKRNAPRSLPVSSCGTSPGEAHGGTGGAHQSRGAGSPSGKRCPHGCIGKRWLGKAVERSRRRRQEGGQPCSLRPADPGGEQADSRRIQRTVRDRD